MTSESTPIPFSTESDVILTGLGRIVWRTVHNSGRRNFWGLIVKMRSDPHFASTFFAEAAASRWGGGFSDYATSMAILRG